MNAKLGAGSIISCAAALVSLQLLMPAAAQAQPAPWTVVPSADANTGNNILAAVTSVAAADVWAVGNSETATGGTQALTEHWDGTAWSLVPSPTPLESGLNGVAAASTSDVWAAGSFLNSASVEQALFEHWNGRKWVQAKSPATGPVTVMNGVAAVSATDIWAVGQAGSSVDRTLIENFNGRKWVVVPSPDVGTGNNRLDAVTAVSANDVWAVGTAQVAGLFQTLTEHWDGIAWSIIPSPNPSGTGSGSELNGAAAVSSSDVWAVGDSNIGTLTEQWNGTSWAVVPSPSPSGALFSTLSGTAVVSANDIWAVGEALNSSGIPATLIEQWNGTTWSTVTSPSPGSAASLRGAAADPVSGQSWAVGSFTSASGAQQTLTEFNP